MGKLKQEEEDTSEIPDFGTLSAPATQADLNRESNVRARAQTALLLSALVAALGASVLAGWALDISFLKSPLPGGVNMKANTATGMLLVGVSLALLALGNVATRARFFGTVVGCGGIVMGMLTLGEYFFGWNVGIDQWLIREAPGAPETTNPGRMSPATAFCFVLIGIGLILASRLFAVRFRLPVLSALSVTVILVAGLGLIGHLSLVLFNVRFWNYAGLAMHTAAGLLVLGCAFLAWVRSEGGLTWSMDAMTTGAFMVGIASIVTVAGVSYNFTDQMRQDSKLVAHSEELLKEIEDLTASQKDLTLSLGRYLITRDESSISDRKRIKEDIQQDIDRIRRLIAINPQQQSRLDQVARLTAQRVAMSDGIIAKVQQQALSGAAPLAGSRDESPLGRVYPAVGLDIDRLLKEMQAEEYALLQRRLARSDSSSTKTFLLMPVGVYLSLTVLLLGLFFLNRGTAERKRLEVVRTRLAAIVESSDDAIIGKDLDGIISSWNKGAENIFGYSSTEMMGQSIMRIVPPERVLEELEILGRLKRGESIEHYETVRQTKDGRRIDISITVSPIVDVAGNVTGASKIARDITHRKETEHRIQYLNRVYATLSAINTLIVRVRDRDELFREACRIAVEQGGFRTSLIGIVDRSAMTIVPVASAGNDENLLTAIKAKWSSSEDAPTTMAGRAIREQKAVVSNDYRSDPNVLFGKKYAEFGVRSMTVLPLIVAGEAVGVLALHASEIEFFHEEELRLLTELAGDIAFAINHIDKQARLDYLATYDVLTNLPNRTLMRDRITQAISHAKRAGRQMALMYLDLDRFKMINDAYGHPLGDAVLKAAAEKLASVVREEDAVARQSGDEFLVLLGNLRKSDDAYVVAQKMLDAFEQPFVVDERKVHVTVSIGVSIYPQDGETADALIGNADVAMYRSKQLGRGTYQFFTQGMSEDIQRRVELETHLRVAIAQDQLHLVYQPKVDLASGRITGCEALLRWNHPELGAISPAHFIPIAEESGLIVPIGDWVLRTACQQNKAWREAGLPPVVVSVNVSTRQFLQQDVVAWVLKTLQETALAPELLELELTESLIAQDTDKVIATINQLKAAGVKHSIDDFGTGYSSLAYLMRFRVDTLKIDQSFIRNMLKNPDSNDAVIALAVIALGHSLRMKVIAEGVETAEHCAFLREHGCDEIQGYYFSKPVPPGDFEGMLKSGKRLAKD